MANKKVLKKNKKNKEIVLNEILKELRLITPEITRLKKARRNKLIYYIIMTLLGIPASITLVKFIKYKYSMPIQNFLNTIHAKLYTLGILDSTDTAKTLNFIDWWLAEYGFKKDIQAEIIQIPVVPAAPTWASYFIKKIFETPKAKVETPLTPLPGSWS